MSLLLTVMFSKCFPENLLVLFVRWTKSGFRLAYRFTPKVITCTTPSIPSRRVVTRDVSVTSALKSFSTFLPMRNLITYAKFTSPQFKIVIFCPIIKLLTYIVLITRRRSVCARACDIDRTPKCFAFINKITVTHCIR